MKVNWKKLIMTSYPKLVFFGNEKIATGITTNHVVSQALAEAGYQIVDEPTGAEAAVLIAYGKILPRTVIDSFPKGIINIHPSLLPKLRGSSPVETAILKGLPKTGVSLMQITAQMDAGPTFAKIPIKLTGTETKQELADKLLALGAELLVKQLPKILDGSLKPVSQNDGLATYTKKIKKSDGAVDFTKSAKQLEREVRAYSGWPKSQARIFGHKVIILKSRVAAGAADGRLVIACRPGWLEILELTAPSGRQVSGAEFLRGYGPKR